jgi:hypothetical protein
VLTDSEMAEREIGLPTRCPPGGGSRNARNCPKLLIELGERGGTRTLDPMIKSHVLYHLSYALTCRAV